MPFSSKVHNTLKRGCEAELEEVNDVLLLTESEDFNALAAFELRQELGHDHVYTLPAEKDLLDAAPAHAEGGLLFAEDLTFSELTQRFEGGARLVELPADSSPDRKAGMSDRVTPLFVVTRTGELQAVTAGLQRQAVSGDTTICLTGGPG
jgi:hypothetical protein